MNYAGVESRRPRQPRRAAPRRRTAPPAERRQQLIDATIRCVANRGLADTTIATVAQEAGLSQGIINLHFQSKERLLTETLRYLSDEYRNACSEARPRPAAPPTAGLQAMVDLDFQPQHLHARTSSPCGLRSGASGSSARPTAASAPSGTDPTTTSCASLCTRLCEQGGYTDVDAALVADGLSALTDGLWLDLLVRPESMSRELARRIAMAYLADAFPTHFSGRRRCARR